MSQMLEGSFDVTPDGKIDMKSGMPPITRRILEEFELLTRDAMRYDTPLPEYAVKAHQIHPKCGEMVSKAAKKLGVSAKKVTMGAVGGFVLALIAQCSLDVNVDVSLNVNELIDQFNMPPLEHPSEEIPTEPTQSETNSNTQRDEPVVVSPVE